MLLREVVTQMYCKNCDHKYSVVKMSDVFSVNRAVHQRRTQEFCSGRGGVQQIRLRIEYRENGDLGAVAP